MYLTLVFNHLLESLCPELYSLTSLEITAIEKDIASKKDTSLPVPFKVAEAIFQAICYNGQGKTLDYFNHITSALTMLAGSACKRSCYENNLVGLLLARGACIKEEPAFAFQTVLTTKNNNVASFCMLALNTFSTLTMTDEINANKTFQMKLIENAITDDDIKKLFSSLDVQYLVACNLTKLVLLNWQQILLQSQCLSSFVVKQSATISTQGYLINPNNCDKQRNLLLEDYPSNQNFIKISEFLATKNTNFEIDDNLFTLTPVQCASQLQLTSSGILCFIEQIKSFFVSPFC